MTQHPRPGPEAMSSGSPREPEPAIYWGDSTAHELARCQANFDKLSKHFQTSDQVSEDEAVAMLQTCGFSSELCAEILHEIYTGGAWAFYTPPPACPTSPWASGNPVTPANLFGSRTCQDKQHCAGADIDAREAAIDLDSCDPAAPPVQPTTAAPSVQPTTRTTSAESSKDQPIQRTSSESGDVATGTQVVPPSSAPSSRNPALHNSQHVQLLPPEHRRTAEQGTNTEPQIQIGPSYESIGFAPDQGWPESPADQRRITPHLWDQLYNAHWGIGGLIPYWSPFYDDFGNVSWYHQDRETGHMTWRTSPPETDHLLWSYANDQTGVIHYYPGPTPL